MSDWKCPEGCKGVPAYGYECPDDLFPDEPCPLGILEEDDEKEKCKLSTQQKTVSTKVVTGKVRLSYPHLFTPTKINDEGEEKYSACLLIPKSDVETLRKIKAAVEAAKQEGISSKWKGKLPGNLKTPLRDGDTEREDSPEYAGHYFLNASSKQKPGIVDKNVQQILDQSEIYPGCYVRVSLNFFPFDAKGNRGVGCGLNNVQKFADGEALAGKSRAEDDFDAVQDGSEDDFLN